MAQKLAEQGMYAGPTDLVMEISEELLTHAREVAHLIEDRVRKAMADDTTPEVEALREEGAYSKTFN